MMSGNKGGGDIKLFDNTRGRTSQVGAAHLMVSLTPAEAPTHLLPGHAGVGAGVVGLWTEVLAVLVRVITPRPRPSVTGRGHGHLPTLTAASNTTRVNGAGLPGLEAAVLIIPVGVEVVSVRSAKTMVTTPPDALIPAHDHLPTLSVVTSVGVGGAVTRPQSSQHQQQRDY